MQGFKNLRKSKKGLYDPKPHLQATAGQKRQRLDLDTDTVSASASSSDESDSNINENELFRAYNKQNAEPMQLSRPSNKIILPQPEKVSPKFE